MRHGYMRLRQKLNINPNNIAPIAVLMGSSGNAPMYTTDGITWQSGTIDAPLAGSPLAGAYNPETGVYLMTLSTSSTTTMTIATSLDGINWTARAKGSTNNFGGYGTTSHQHRLIYSPTFGGFIGISSNNNIVKTVDGVTWQSFGSVSTVLLNVTNVHDTGNALVIGSFANDGSGRVIRSTNLTSWTTVRSTTASAGDYPYTFGSTSSAGNIILASNASFTRSTNGGSSWSAYTGPAGSGGSNSRFARSSTGRLVYSSGTFSSSRYSDDNGVTWNPLTGAFGVTSSSRLIVTHNDRFIMMPSSTNAATYSFSVNGIHWEAIPMPMTLTSTGCHIIACPAPA